MSILKNAKESVSAEPRSIVSRALISRVEEFTNLDTVPPTFTVLVVSIKRIKLVSTISNWPVIQFQSSQDWNRPLRSPADSISSFKVPGVVIGAKPFKVT